jgi:hypothetical protein
MPETFDELIRRLIDENKIDAPIVDIRVVGGKIAFQLYGGEVVVCIVRKDCAQTLKGEEVKIAL